MRVGRGLFRLWLAVSILWVALVGVRWWNAVSMGHPLSECIHAQNANQCADLLSAAGKNPDAAFENPRGIPVAYGRTVEPISFTPFAYWMIVPSAVLLAFGATLIWIGRGFSPNRK